MKVFTTAAILSFLVSCATIGTRIDPEAFGKFKVGETTIEQAIAMMGRPSLVTQGTGLTIYGWTWAHATAFGGAQAESVQLTFGQDGRLTNKTTSRIDNRINHEADSTPRN